MMKLNMAPMPNLIRTGRARFLRILLDCAHLQGKRNLIHDHDQLQWPIVLCEFSSVNFIYYILTSTRMLNHSIYG